MGLFSRRQRSRADDAAAPLHEGKPVSAPLTERERDRIRAGLGRLADKGIDVDDLAAIGAGYDRDFAAWHADRTVAEPDAVVETYAVAIGEHLARHGGRRWAIVTDVFGTDLGLVSARSETVIVPHNLVGARWMRGETGWVPGVVGHLAGLEDR